MTRVSRSLLNYPLTCTWPGWVRTADQYFDFLVGPMYTTVIDALSNEPSRRFQAVEMVYFKQWYDAASAKQRSQAQHLVRTGQLTFSVGGWVMPDEATTDYADLVETMSLGHQWIYETFEGARVKHGFQVDPFGASSSFAAISRKLGLETHLVARLNYYDKGWMQDNQQLEFLWRPSPSLWHSEGLEIFTHIMDQYQYSAPGIPVKQQLEHLCSPPHNQTDCPGGGFYWDGDDSHPSTYWTEQIKKQGFAVYPGVNNSNVQFYADFLVNNSKSRSEWFKTSNLLWPFGTDFQYSNATAMFSSMDKIIQYVNSRNGPHQRYAHVKLQYSSLQEYFTAVHKSKQDGWGVRGGSDFLPYTTLDCQGISSKPLPGQCSGNAGPQYPVSWPQVWSGFFTSHAQLKIQTRTSARELRATDHILALAPVHHTARETEEAIHPLRSAVGLLPHHDAISGTMGPGCGNDPARGQDPSKCTDLPMGTPGNTGEVAKDYAARLASGVKTAHKLRELGAEMLLHTHQDDDIHSNQTAFEQLSNLHPAHVAVQNPLGWTLSSWMQFSIPRAVRRVRVFDSSKRPVKADLIAGGALDCSKEQHTLCEASKGGASQEPSNTLFFRAQVPPLGLTAYTIEPVKDGDPNEATELTQPLDYVSRNFTVSNHFFELSFESGTLVSVKDLTGSERLDVSQTLEEYESFSDVVNQTSDGSWSLSYSGSRSGSYLLHSSAAAPGPLTDAYFTPRIQVVDGAFVTEVRQQFSPTHSQVWRIYQDVDPIAAGYVEIQYGVGPLGGNRELVSNFDTNGGISTLGANGSVFFTDDNGFQMQRRVYTGFRSFPDHSEVNVSPDPTYTTALSYYPVVRTAYIQDHRKQLLLLTQQPQAATSRTDGQVEVMMHRRSLQDDSKGACQCFNDTSGGYANIPVDTSAGVNCSGYEVAGTCRADSCPAYAVPMNISTRVEPIHWLLAGARRTVDSRWRQLSQVLNNRPTLLTLHGTVGSGVYAPFGWKNPGLPPQIHILSLQKSRQHGNVRLLRLQNIYEIGDGHTRPVVVDWFKSGLCRVFGRAPVKEVLLNGLPMNRHVNNQSNDFSFRANESIRLDLLGSRGGAAAESLEPVEYKEYSKHASTQSADACQFHTTMWPQDIRTFLIGHHG